MTTTNVQWQCRRFAELDTATLHAILQLRQQVFVIEQMCPYPDIDGRDPDCLHVYAQDADGLLAYLRVVPAARTDSGCPALGRVCTAARARSGGFGRELVNRGLQALAQHYPGQACVIGAQAYLRRFYEGCGFAVFDQPYQEDGIPHFHMRRPAD
ncbi:GNAT family N-acetyltransferase [Permianibacter sp. IMCC34836]|uniref:GNAT family N-acetyltransferase n=1 Tax=Permianibacter fluminis TaxID=2738515 RepID=UPI00155796E0|nr:GNAT family N-acetyltransferase [Permianibacter fluminis]NQD35427.1 GNAT family N-acetyltransferase [Permianibacter fluminis]